MENSLINRYIYAVVRHLPPEQAAGVESELIPIPIQYMECRPSSKDKVFALSEGEQSMILDGIGINRQIADMLKERCSESKPGKHDIVVKAFQARRVSPREMP